MKYFISLILCLINTSSFYGQSNAEPSKSVSIGTLVRYDYYDLAGDGYFSNQRSELLSDAMYDSTWVEGHINELEQQYKRSIDTDSKVCDMYVIAEPFDFQFSLLGETKHFNQEDFYKEQKSQDILNQYEYRCFLGSYERSENVQHAYILSDGLNVDCQLNLSYTSIRIEDLRNVTLVDSIYFNGINENGLPILKEKLVTTEGYILVAHGYSVR